MVRVTLVSLVVLTAACAGSRFQAMEIAPPLVADRPAAPAPERFVTQPPGPADPRIELHYGSGTCAPRLPDGTLGTCINDRPCNGFGFRDERGAIVCACYQVVGGCDAESVCSIRKRTCVRHADDLQRGPVR